MVGSKEWMREKTLDRIEEAIASSNGLGISEIAEEIGTSIQTVVEDVKILLQRGRITKGVKKNIGKDGTFTGGLGPAYYTD